jgi:alpha-mannosidase
MPLTTQQRLARLRVRIGELPPWREQAVLPIGGWLFDGAPIALGEPWPNAEGVVHLSASANVPEDWPLESTRLQLDLGGETLLTLRDEKGHTTTLGLDPYHQEFTIPARRFSIEAESVARFPFGEPNRDPRLARAQLVLLDEPVHHFALLMQQLTEAIEVLEDHPVVPSLIEAGEAALRSLSWPSDTQSYIARTRDLPGQRRIWALPQTIDNPPPLSKDERDSVSAAHQDLVERLRALQERYPQQGELLLTGHAHIDLAWLWPYDETRRKMRRTFGTALSLAERFPDFRFNQSTAHYYAQIEEDDPKLFERIKAAARSGAWEPVGGLWVEPDTNMPTGESLARQVLYGQLYFERTFGHRHAVCWLPDCFGFSPALPQLLRQGGIDSFFTIKVNWSETNKFPLDLFWWEGLDGSRVLAHTFDNPKGGYNGVLQPAATLATWRNFRGKALHPTSLLAIGYGDGGGGTTPEMIEREKQLRDFPALPKLRWGHVSDFFARAHETAQKADFPVWSGEIYLELHRSTLTTQSAVKRLHRKAERALITAETVSSLAHLLGSEAPPSLEPDWRVVLKNEFHDILPGSGIAEVYADARRELTGVIESASTREADALQHIAERLPQGPIEQALVVVNATLQPRPLRLDADGERLASTDILTPLSVTVLDRAALRPTPGLVAETNRLENDNLIAIIGSDGAVQSLVHKPSGHEALDGSGNQLWVYPVDKPRNWDAWDLEDDYAAVGERLTRPESIELIESTPHRAAIRVVYAWRNSRIVQIYGLDANGRRLDIETHLDWHDRRALLRTLTPAAVRSRHATFECAYGVIERPTHSNTSWDAAMFEATAHRFIDLSERGFGLALLNDGKYGHSVRDNLLGLSLVRSPIYPDPLADEGEQRFTYALMPHRGDWFEGGVREEADDLNQPLVGFPSSGLAATHLAPLAVSGYPVSLSALKPAEDGKGLILRLNEGGGGRGTVTIDPPEGWRVSGPLSILEEPMDAEGFTLTPFAVRSFRLERG